MLAPELRLLLFRRRQRDDGGVLELAVECLGHRRHRIKRRGRRSLRQPGLEHDGRRGAVAGSRVGCVHIVAAVTQHLGLFIEVERQDRIVASQAIHRGIPPVDRAVDAFVSVQVVVAFVQHDHVVIEILEILEVGHEGVRALIVKSQVDDLDRPVEPLLELRFEVDGDRFIPGHAVAEHRAAAEHHHAQFARRLPAHHRTAVAVTIEAGRTLGALMHDQVGSEQQHQHPDQ